MLTKSSVLSLSSIAVASFVVSGCGNGSSKGGPVASTAPASTSVSRTAPPSAAAPAPKPAPATPAPVPSATPAPVPSATATHRLVIAGWLPYWSTVGGDSVKKNVGKGLDEVNAFWYGFDESANLVAKKGARDVALIAAIHNNKGIVVPTVFDVDKATATPKVIASATLRAKLLQQIVSEVDRWSYDGIDLDFEHLPVANRDAFSAFVADVAKEMHARKKIVSIAVPGKTKDKAGWAAATAIDWVAVGKSVDRLKIMTYGVHGSFSGPGPIGPLGYSESCIKYALTCMPASKVYLGIPFFGYDWPSTGKAVSVTYSSAQTRIAKSHSGVKYSAADGESTFTYVEAGITHTVWFQDQKGIAAKAALAKKHQIGGLAAWAIGGEGADFFTVLDKAR